MAASAPSFPPRTSGSTSAARRSSPMSRSEVREGEFVGIIGPNGAGKTSLFNLLSGLYRPTAGRSSSDGRDITNQPPYRRTQEGLGRTFQISSVFPRLMVLENARLAAEAGLGNARVWRRCGVLQALERARWALVRVGLGTREAAEAGALAHGDKLEARARNAARPRPAGDPARRAHGRREHGGRAGPRRGHQGGRVAGRQDGAHGRAPSTSSRTWPTGLP